MSDDIDPEEMQRLRTKYRIERRFAEQNLGVESGAPRDEIRAALLDASQWEREQLGLRKQRAYRRLDDLMTV